MDILETLKRAKYVRYNNRIYSIEYKYDNIYFTEYHLAKLGDIYEFYLDISKKKYVNYSCSSNNIEDMYNTVLQSLKITDNPQQEYITCLEDIYRASIIAHITDAEKEQRERIHRSILRKYIYDDMKSLLSYTYKCVAKSSNTIIMRFPYSEEKFIEFNKYPILYDHTNSDGVQRSTFREYIRYIFIKEFPLAEEMQIDDHIGTVLKNIIFDIWPSFTVTYNIESTMVFPTLSIVIPIRTNNILL